MSEKSPAKPTKDVIYVDVDDEITSIIDKVENSQHKVVALVLPKRAASLQSIVNMKLLKRSADAAEKNPVLITSEAALTPLAGAAGLHVAKNLQSKPEIPAAPAIAGAAAAAGLAHRAADDEIADDTEALAEEDLPGKIDYEKPVGELAAAHEADNAETIDLDDEPADEPKPKKSKKPKISTPKIPDFDRFRLLMIGGAVALVALIVFIILAAKVLPKATITIQTVSEPVSTNFTLTASTSIKTLDVAKGQIPATQQSSDQTGSQQVTATGQQNNGDKATGSVVMTSQVCAPNLGNTPSSVPAGTGISSGGVSFITQSSATLNFNGGSGSCINYKSGSINIVAQAAGSKYNISGGTFTVAGRSDVSASGSASGGSDNIVTILSQSDVDGAKQKIASGSSADDFTKEFKKKLEDQNLYIITSTLKANDPVVTSSPSVGQPASNATVTVKITYTVLTVKKDDLSQVIEAKLADHIDKTKQKLAGHFLDDTDITVQSQSSANSATLAVNVETTAVPIIAVGTVKKTSAGKKSGEIKAVIGNWPGVKDVDVKLSPFWVSKVPKKDSKITIVIKEVKSDSSNSSEP